MSLESRIDSLKTRHHELEKTIAQHETHPFIDEIEIHALKKEKLKIKDELEQLTHH